ncbi:hypothetical protein [Burkholderia aenigmatica]|uniref:hypothetical protein n=1 Tax=Burkholderia aenigmatica TaxID=2015348 RepID=UPI0015832973|nr:hypothetical protein [Burkholderia aenigmatica]
MKTTVKSARMLDGHKASDSPPSKANISSRRLVCAARCDIGIDHDGSACVLPQPFRFQLQLFEFRFNRLIE